MLRFQTLVGLPFLWLVTALWLITGCQPAERTDITAGDESVDGAAATATVVKKVEAARPATSFTATSHSGAQISAAKISEAKQFAEDLGIRTTEDAQGRVIGIDTAVGRSWADDAQMQEILVFADLESLTLEGPGISDALVPRIAEQTNLSLLALRNTLVSDQGIAQLHTLGSLRVIDLRVSPLITDAAMKSLAQMPQLRAVRLVGGNVSNIGVHSLLELPQLSELDVRNCRGVTKKGIDELTGKRSLRTVKIGGPQIDDQVLSSVGQMTQITNLWLDNGALTDEGMAHLSGLSLVNLSLYQCTSITDTGVSQALSANNDLQRLSLRDVSVTGSFLQSLPHPEKLGSLNMAQSKFEDADVALLARFANLELLNLSETRVSDSAIDAFLKITSLRQLNLAQTEVSSEGKDRLRQGLRNCEVH